VTINDAHLSWFDDVADSPGSDRGIERLRLTDREFEKKFTHDAMLVKTCGVDEEISKCRLGFIGTRASFGSKKIQNGGRSTRG
jgi:hypothetical protein